MPRRPAHATSATAIRDRFRIGHRTSVLWFSTGDPSSSALWRVKGQGVRPALSSRLPRSGKLMSGLAHGSSQTRSALGGGPVWSKGMVSRPQRRSSSRSSATVPTSRRRRRRPSILAGAARGRVPSSRPRQRGRAAHARPRPRRSTARARNGAREWEPMSARREHTSPEQITEAVIASFEGCSDSASARVDGYRSRTTSCSPPAEASAAEASAAGATASDQLLGGGPQPCCRTRAASTVAN
jgi:hypothetical protein